MIQQSHLQVFTQKKESTLWKDNMHSITAALFLIAKHMKATKVFIGGWMDKEDVAYMHNGISLAIKKKWSFAFCDNMDGSRCYYTKSNVRQRQIPHNLTYMCIKTNKTKCKLIDTENKSLVARREGWESKENRWRGLRSTNLQL